MFFSLLKHPLPCNLSKGGKWAQNCIIVYFHSHCHTASKNPSLIHVVYLNCWHHFITFRCPVSLLLQSNWYYAKCNKFSGPYKPQIWTHGRSNWVCIRIKDDWPCILLKSGWSLDPDSNSASAFISVCPSCNKYNRHHLYPTRNGSTDRPICTVLLLRQDRERKAEHLKLDKS